MGDLQDRWRKPPWEWGVKGAFAVFILACAVFVLVGAIVLLLEQENLLSLRIQTGLDGGVTIVATFQPDEAISVPPAGEEVEISLAISGPDSISQPSTCSLEVQFPDEPPISLDPVAVNEDGMVTFQVPSESFPAAVEATPVTADVTADCAAPDEQFEIPVQLDFVAE